MRIYISPLILIILCVSSGTIFSQSQNLSFNKTSLDNVIIAFEQESNYVFNYDPLALESFYFSGDVSTSNIDKALTIIFDESPYAYEIDGQTILIYKAAPKPYRICGTIVDAITQEALIGANVYAIDTYKGTQSDANGFFDFSITSEKNQKIEIRYIGYTTRSLQVSHLNEDVCGTLVLEVDKGLIGEEIVIRDYIIDGIIQGDTYSSFRLNYDRLSQNHSSVEHDILKTAQLLPGITSIDDSASNLQIRGSSPGQNLILWEDAPIYNAGHIFGMISAINPFSIENMNIYKGAHDPKYDNRVGGIVDISLSDQISNESHGSIGTTLTEVHSNLDIPMIADRLSLEIAGRRNFAGIYDSPALQSYTDKVFQFSIIDDQANSGDLEGLNTAQRLNYYDWNAKLLYVPSDRLQLNIGTYHNYQDFEYSYGFDDDPFQVADNIKVNTSLISTEANWKVNNSWTVNGSFYNSEYQNDYTTEETENGLLINSNEQTNGIKDQSFTISSDVILSPPLMVSAGYIYDKKKVNLTWGEGIGFEPDLLTSGEKAATFQNIFQSLSYTNEQVKLEIGNRSSYYQEIKSWFHSPRFNLQYAINTSLKLKLDGGIYHQFLNQLTNLNIDQIRVDNPIWILNTNESELSQKSYKFALGFIYNKDGWLLDIEAYHNQVKGLNTLSPLLGSLSSSNPFSTGNSIVKGIDALIKKQWGDFNSWINYSMGVAEYEFPAISDAPITAPNDIRHNLNFASTYKLNNFQFSLSANYHSGLPYTLPFLQFNEDDPDAEPPFLYFLGYENYNTFRLPPYFRLDLNTAYRFNLNTSGSIQSEVSLSIINVLNRKNVFDRGHYVEYNDDTALYKLSSGQKVLLGRTPLLLLRVYW